MSRCERCGGSDSTATWSKGKGRRRITYCKPCRSVRHKASMRLRYKRGAELMLAAKSRPCADCNVRYRPYQMDFDHVRGSKRGCLARMTTQSLDAIRAEIAKCDVVCSNCHRHRTWIRRLFPD